MYNTPWSEEEKTILWRGYGVVSLDAVADRIKRLTGRERTTTAIRKMASRLGLRSEVDGALDVSEVARELGISCWAMYRLGDAGVFHSFKKRGYRYMDIEEVDKVREYLESKNGEYATQVTITKAAEMLGYNSQHLGRIFKKRGIPVERYGNRKYVLIADVERLRAQM